MIKWESHVVRIGDEKYVQFLSLKRRRNSEDVGSDERLILKLILKVQDMKKWIGFMWFRADVSVGLL
jgi:hypothetical protein